MMVFLFKKCVAYIEQFAVMRLESDNLSTPRGPFYTPNSHQEADLEEHVNKIKVHIIPPGKLLVRDTGRFVSRRDLGNVQFHLFHLNLA